VPKCSPELPETLPDPPKNTPKTSPRPPQTLPRHTQDHTRATKTSFWEDFLIFGVILIGLLDLEAAFGRVFELI